MMPWHDTTVVIGAHILECPVCGYKQSIESSEVLHSAGHRGRDRYTHDLAIACSCCTARSVYVFDIDVSTDVPSVIMQGDVESVGTLDRENVDAMREHYEYALRKSGVSLPKKEEERYYSGRSSYPDSVRKRMLAPYRKS